MISPFYLAWCYIRFNWVRSLLLLTCISLIIVLPLSLQLLLDESRQTLRARADSTPLLIGARGSALDLVMNSLYFGGKPPESLSMRDVEYVNDSGLALPIPLYTHFQARGFPIIGTDLDYFAFRELKLATGRHLTTLGECILGAEVARALKLVPGDTLVTSPKTLFDLAGIYPLKMHVAGVLEPTQTADDRAIFVDLKTTWVIKGLSHGHADLTDETDPTLVMERNGNQVSATAKITTYTEITSDNIDSFHLHGDPDSYPVSAIIAIPDDDRASVLLRGRYVEHQTQQIQVPTQIIDQLLASILRLKQLLDSVIAVVTTATVLALVLVFALTLRIRQPEIQTMFKLGGSRSTIAKALFAEILIIASIAICISAVVLALVAGNSDFLVRTLFLNT